jgi:tetratricopeptide (TPR) repeat protein
VTSSTSKNPETGNAPDPGVKFFKEAVVIMDDDTWLWGLVERTLNKWNTSFVKLASSMTIRQSWNRFHDTPFMIIHWESKFRGGGAITEEILEIDKRYDAANKLIIITTNPIHEDVVYFAELGIKRVIRARQRDKEMLISAEELAHHIQDILNPPAKSSIEGLWRKIIVALDKLPEDPPEALLSKIVENISKLRDPSKPPSARDLEAMGCVNLKRKQYPTAIRLLNDAIQANPNYFRAWNTLIDVKRQMGEHAEAYALLQKMQMHNRGSVRRLVAMGEEQIALNDMRKAEHCFKSALDKDAWCAKALNGLAEVKFDQDELDEARSLLAKSTIAYRVASKLNLIGVNLVRAGEYERALEHYSKAQYVLPQQEKGPQLLYNIALCYAKWGRMPMADEFLKLALIKEPNYKKASRLLDLVRAKSANSSDAGLDAA